MSTETIHYCKYTSTEFPNAFAICGKLVPTAQVYDEEHSQAVTCKACLKAMKAEDKAQLERDVRRGIVYN